MVKKIISAAEKIIIPFIVFTILSISFVFASGVATPYWKGNPLTISAGKTETVYLTLQNMVGTEDITFRAKIINGSEIATIESKDYLVKAGTRDTQFPVKIKIQANETLNKTYTVTISFNTVASLAGGGVALGTGMDTSFDVQIVPETKEEKPAKLPWLLIISILIIIVVIFIIIIKRRKK